MRNTLVLWSSLTLLTLQAVVSAQEPPLNPALFVSSASVGPTTPNPTIEPTYQRLLFEMRVVQYCAELDQCEALHFGCSVTVTTTAEMCIDAATTAAEVTQCEDRECQDQNACTYAHDQCLAPLTPFFNDGSSPSTPALAAAAGAGAGTGDDACYDLQECAEVSADCRHLAFTGFTTCVALIGSTPTAQTYSGCTLQRMNADQLCEQNFAQCAEGVLSALQPLP
jgi:hypothetical protein